MKSSRPSLRETRDKRPLDRDPDRSRCHRHTSVKLSWSQSMHPWTEWQHTHMLSLMSMGHWLRPKKLYHTHGVAVTPGPVRVPIQRPLVPSFT